MIKKLIKKKPPVGYLIRKERKVVQGGASICQDVSQLRSGSLAYTYISIVASRIHINTSVYSLCRSHAYESILNLILCAGYFKSTDLDCTICRSNQRRNPKWWSTLKMCQFPALFVPKKTTKSAIRGYLLHQ